MMKTLKTFLTLGVMSLISLSLTSCMENCVDDLGYMGYIKNSTDDLIFLHVYETDTEGTPYLINSETLWPNKIPYYSQPILLSQPYLRNRNFKIELCDSVIVVLPKGREEGDTTIHFEFHNIGDCSEREYYYEFTDEYITEIADTMRKLGVEPYRLSKEVVKNSSSKDFTLGIVTPNKTYEYEVKSGDETEIEMKWLMESEDTCGLHRFDFSFKDSTLTVYPFVTSGERLQTHRFFSAETTRDGGGKRTYEITDKMFSEMDKEMRKIKEVRPWIFK